jgi:hypothetical protein
MVGFALFKVKASQTDKRRSYLKVDPHKLDPERQGIGYQILSFSGRRFAIAPARGNSWLLLARVHDGSPSSALTMDLPLQL